MPKKATRKTREARLACEKWRQHFKFNIDQYHKLTAFVYGRQWDNDEEDMLRTNNKVALQNNKLATINNTLLGEILQNTPQIETVPLSDCDPQAAEIRIALTKDISLSSDAKKVIQIAADQAITGGFGAFTIDRMYSQPKSFEQTIVYRAHKDPTCFYWSIDAQNESKTDSMRAGYHVRISRERFRARFGKKLEELIFTDMGKFQTEEEIALAVEPTNGSANDDPFTWIDDDGITLLYDYHRTFVKDTLYKMSNHKVLNQQEMDELVDQSLRRMRSLNTDMPAENSNENAVLLADPDMDLIPLYDDGMPVRIEEKRITKKSIITERLIGGDYILDESKFPADDVPIIFVDQKSWYDKNGKQYCRPFIIDAVDTQRYINYLSTQSAYLLKISRYDQFLVSKKNVQSMDTAANWRDPSRVRGALTYDESPSGAKPEQLRPPELSQSLMSQFQRAMDDIYTCTGMYAARLGQAGNEISGTAIDSRTRQGSYSTYVSLNSINRASTAGAQIVNQMIPNVYDTERVISIMTPDKGQQHITINQQMDDYGAQIKNDIRKGTYEVRLQAGPSYEGQKQEAIDSFNMLIQAQPALLNYIADLYAENLPLANTLEIKNRLKTIVPQQVIQAGKTGEMPPPQQQQPDPQTILAQQEMKLKQGQLQLKAQEIQQKAQANESQYQIEIQKLQKEYAELDAEMHDMQLRFQAENNKTAANIAMGHSDNLARILTHNPGLHNAPKSM